MIRKLDIPGLLTWTPRRFSDPRGTFAETYSQHRLAPWLGDDLVFVQDNHSVSVPMGTVRGLHFQIPPFAQDKLVWVIHGAIRDVVVDIRKSSPTYGRHISISLNEESGEQLFIPKGFAHGIETLRPNTEILYKVTARYSVEHERGILWHDPELGIQWGVSPEQAIMSAKDTGYPPFASLPEYFP